MLSSASLSSLLPLQSCQFKFPVKKVRNVVEFVELIHAERLLPLSRISRHARSTEDLDGMVCNAISESTTPRSCDKTWYCNASGRIQTMLQLECNANAHPGCQPTSRVGTA
ncbi:uncharacterized protein [Physcomitrium patens]|uniref:uncharacterized protein n=1 Tax=Physcomitrium patens TaxID=3218 RepID=UPI003CCE1D79